MVVPKDLRIGNWVDLYDSETGSHFIQVNLSNINSNQFFNPIQLTSEVFEKCGFERGRITEDGEEFDEVNGYLIYQSSKYYWFDVFINADNKICIHYLKTALYKHPQFLHQLQNVIYDLTGEELTVKF